MSFEVRQGDCVELMATMPAGSVDAVVCDPPYGLEFMGKDWDAFRQDTPTSSRHRGERAGDHGRLEGGSYADGGRKAKVSYGGGGKRPSTQRCVECGKRDQFNQPHEPCGVGTWERVTLDPHSAPPSMLAFQTWCEGWATEALRVLKPGGHLLAFGGTRTYHRLVCAVEDAGFEIRDTISWLYGSGFPKSLDVSKAIDRAAKCPDCEGGNHGGTDEAMGGTPTESGGADGGGVGGHQGVHSGEGADGGPAGGEVAAGGGRGGVRECPTCRGTGRPIREIVGVTPGRMPQAQAADWGNPGVDKFRDARKGTVDMPVTAPATPEAERWEGWGTALKPAWESIVVGRKPLGEADIIRENLCVLQAKLLSLSSAQDADESSLSRPAVQDALDHLVTAGWTVDELTSTRAALCEAMGTSQFETGLTTSLNTVSSWLGTLAALCELTSTFTTETASATTTALQTLKSSLSDLTPRTIIEDASRTGGLSFSALPAVRAFNGVESRLSATRELLAPAPATDASQEPFPHGDAKPDMETVVVARKPLSGTVAGNVLEHGTGALNVDGCRVGDEQIRSSGWTGMDARRFEHGTRPQNYTDPSIAESSVHAGRWPANVVLSHTEGCVQVGTRKVRGSAPASGPTLSATESVAHGDYTGERVAVPSYQDETVGAWSCTPDCPVRLLDEQTGESVSSDRARHNTAEAHNRTQSMGQSSEDWTTGGYADAGGRK